MHKASIPHDALVFVGDGTRAVFLRNRGSIQKPDLAVEAVLRQPDPPTREQGSDRPGRMHQRLGSARSALESTDWHRLAEERFAVAIADTLYQLAHANRFERLIVIAPARVLGTLRKSFHKEVRERVAAEVQKEVATRSLA